MEASFCRSQLPEPVSAHPAEGKRRKHLPHKRGQTVCLTGGDDSGTRSGSIRDVSLRTEATCADAAPAIIEDLPGAGGTHRR